MTHNIEHGNANHQLYAQKHKSTYDALITTRVMYDMARVRRENLVSIFNDLKGCYDRVRPALNTITTRRMGLPKGHAVCHAKVLRLMKHRIRTGFGISEESIFWTEFQNLGGIGQGNGAGPISWHSHCLVLVIAYKIMTNERVVFTNPDSSKKFIQWLVGYVDDNTLLTKLNEKEFSPNAHPELIKKAKICLEIWQCLIHITGGELEREKSCLSMIAWKEAKGKEVLITKEESSEAFSLQSVRYPGSEVNIQRNDVHKGERILGVRLSLDGNDLHKFQHRKD